MRRFVGRCATTMANRRCVPVAARALSQLPAADVTEISSAPYEAPSATRDHAATTKRGGAPRTQEKLLVSDTNVAVVVGVVDNVLCGQHLGQDLTEFRLVATNRRVSGDGSALVEKQAFKVVLQDRFALLGRSMVTPGSVMHIVGRLHFQPRFNASTLAYDHAHELVVSDRCGALTPVLREGAVPPERPMADDEWAALSVPPVTIVPEAPSATDADAGAPLASTDTASAKVATGELKSEDAPAAAHSDPSAEVAV